MPDLESASRQVQKSIEDRRREIIGFLSQYLQRKSVNPRYEEGAEERT